MQRWTFFMWIFCWGMVVDGWPGPTYDFLRLGLAKKNIFFISRHNFPRSFSFDAWRGAKGTRLFVDQGHLRSVRVEPIFCRVILTNQHLRRLSRGRPIPEIEITIFEASIPIFTCIIRYNIVTESRANRIPCFNGFFPCWNSLRMQCRMCCSYIILFCEVM